MTTRPQLFCIRLALRAAALAVGVLLRLVQRDNARRGWLLRYVSDSRVCLQVAAVRAASKHIGGCRKRGKADRATGPVPAFGARRRWEPRGWPGAGLRARIWQVPLCSRDTRLELGG